MYFLENDTEDMVLCTDYNGAFEVLRYSKVREQNYFTVAIFDTKIEALRYQEMFKLYNLNIEIA